VSAFNPLEIPEFIEAVLAERLARDAAFLGVSEDVAGFALRAMTLQDYLALGIAQNPLLNDAEPTEDQLAAFLWFLSVDYDSASEQRRLRFLKRCRVFAEPTLPFLHTQRALRRWARRKQAADQRRLEITSAALAYVAETLQDRPARREAHGYSPSYYSDAIYWCALLGREYGYPVREVLALPLKALFGFVMEIKEAHGVNEPHWNPSDRIISQWLARQNQFS
jgi:hypothetical protein